MRTTLRTAGLRACRGLAIATAIAATAATIAGAAGPREVGTLEPISIEVAGPYGARTGGPAGEWVVSDPGATYIRLHFARFDLAPGDAVVVSRLDGSASSTYRGLGPHGSGEFWALAVPGDGALVRLQAGVGGGGGFEIDAYGRGFEPIFGEPTPPGTESVCGTQDWRDVECYRGTPEFDHARAAVKLLIGCCSACTGFKVSDSGQFLTNNHCTSSQSGVQSTQLILEYQTSSCGGGGTSDTGSVLGNALVSTDFTLDYTLMTTTGDASSIPCLALDDRLAPAGEPIYIAGHPSAGPKKLSIDSDIDGGHCQVDRSPYNGNGSGTDLAYYCDTTNGSSGSPVISEVTQKVVALHHFGGCLNSGARSDLILGKLGNELDACSGGGGGGTCGDGTCDPGETSCSCPADCGSSPAFETSCANGADDDCDGFADCADTDCASDPACAPPACLGSGATCSSHSDCCSGKCTGGKRGHTCK